MGPVTGNLSATYHHPEKILHRISIKKHANNRPSKKRSVVNGPGRVPASTGNRRKRENPGTRTRESFLTVQTRGNTSHVRVLMSHEADLNIHQ